jgi:hypothetical protein
MPLKQICIFSFDYISGLLKIPDQVGNDAKHSMQDRLVIAGTVYLSLPAATGNPKSDSPDIEEHTYPSSVMTDT